MDDTRLQELVAREQIKELKARYWRCVDAEDWDGFRRVLSDDVHFEVPGGDPIEGGDRFTAFVRASTEGCQKTHHGHMPEISFENPNEAHVVWVLNDYKEWPAAAQDDGRRAQDDERRGFKGYGHYHETYRKIEGEWKIAWLTVSYIRMDPLYPGRLPELGVPEAAADSTLGSAGSVAQADHSERAADRLSDAPLQALIDREAIKQLKARYFESLDMQDWDAFRQVFTDDAHFELVGSAPIDGADAFVQFTSNALNGARTVHHGHNPQLAITGPGEAQGAWRLTDYVEWPPDPDTGVRRGIEGFGRYDETYRKLDGQWQIANWRLSYSRIDPLPREPLPEMFLDGRGGARAQEEAAQRDRVRTGHHLFRSARYAPRRQVRKPDSRLVQELLDREAITELKARYFRLVDAQDWDGWRELFTEDCRIDLLPDVVIEGGENYVAAVREMTQGVLTVHQGHMPMIAIDGPTEAHGTWALFDYLEWPSDPETGERRGRKGYGHERETYRKVDGQWKIASMYLSYLRRDPLPREPLPERVVGPPAEHVELSQAASRQAQARSAASAGLL